ncbi:unnamed protein product [Pleuronectes platessa]|uniref:Uncharacterized protein n=1 Tax=Pleuronectes platessa TaxID=8262 RepID=A0A9N7VC82_PLEPL|nr:unnamed protein product [Pleuronectes platessa]
MRCSLAERGARAADRRADMDGGGADEAVLPERGLRAGSQDRLRRRGRELANQHSGELRVSSSADHSGARAQTGGEWQRYVFIHKSMGWGGNASAVPISCLQLPDVFFLTLEGPEPLSLCMRDVGNMTPACSSSSSTHGSSVEGARLHVQPLHPPPTQNSNMQSDSRRNKLFLNLLVRERRTL